MSEKDSLKDQNQDTGNDLPDWRKESIQSRAAEIAEDINTLDAFFNKLIREAAEETQRRKSMAPQDGNKALSEQAPVSEPARDSNPEQVFASIPAPSPSIPPKHLRTLLLHTFRFDSIVITIPYDEAEAPSILPKLNSICRAEKLHMHVTLDEEDQHFDIVIEKQPNGNHENRIMALEHVQYLLNLVGKGYCTLFADTVE
ncbi:hypothetical protein KJ951_00350 [Patescibacteria group bacterium]|nr:hypothetical protein [Patescibacteria group bacterium]MBU1954116.1 hypothetical protein [Patescibacteria group bacterium]